MELNKKSFGILVLAVFLVSAVPLAMARYGDSSGSDQGSMTGNVVSSGSGSDSGSGAGSDSGSGTGEVSSQSQNSITVNAVSSGPDEGSYEKQGYTGGDSVDDNSADESAGYGSNYGNGAEANDNSDDKARYYSANDYSGPNSYDNNENNYSDVGNLRFANVTECVAAYKEKVPGVNETKIQAACEYAFKVREALAPKFGEVLPRVQRFMVQNQEHIQAWLEKLDNRSTEMIQKLDRARLKECLNDTEACKEQLKDWKLKAEKVKDMIRERVVAKDKLNEANKNFLKAKNQYLVAKDAQLIARDEFLGLKEQLAQCKEDGGDNCTAIEEQLLEKGKEDMLALADRLIQHLEKIKSKIEAADNLNETDANTMIDKIDGYISQLEDAKDAVDAADTQEELKEAAQGLKDLWNDMDYYAKRYAERVIHAYTQGVFVRSELLETKLDEVLNKLENKSIDTSEMEDLLDNYSNYIDVARTKMENASDLFNKAKALRDSGDKEGAKEKLDEANALTKEAHEALKEAHNILMDLVHKINQKGASFDPDEINEDDDVKIVEHNDSHDVNEVED